jgi:2-(acetamidomethylene)succinate hydrolase
MGVTPSVVDIGDGLSRTRGAGVELAFRVRGSGPAVVLLHGTSANHAVWEPVGDLLADRATVVALDQRGHGRSDKPDRGYAGDDFDELAVRVAGGFRAFADVAEIEAYLAARYPRILPGAISRRARWGYRPMLDGRWAPLASPAAMAQLIDGFRTPYDDEFRSVASAMTHLRGDASAIVSEGSWERAQQDRPDDRWVDVATADHYIPEEHPDIVAAEIARALGV